MRISDGKRESEERKCGKRVNGGYLLKRRVNTKKNQHGQLKDSEMSGLKYAKR
jgi:hypothetical protein